MKRFIFILIVIFLSYAIDTFACNGCSEQQNGHGHFYADVLRAITITYDPTSGAEALGTFVVCSTAYSIDAAEDIKFVIAGEPNHDFYYKIVEDESDNGASLSITWKRLDGTILTIGSGQLGNFNETDGKFTIRAIPTSFTTGTISGAKTFTQWVYANYSGGL
ncbi:MAG: hypothetical protein HZB41_14450 [Ignavibacteriae bacterium]|nr:hypothetical protein [Ignavibacteriota bacterium]